jgi:hypothetical protein
MISEFAKRAGPRGDARGREMAREIAKRVLYIQDKEARQGRNRKPDRDLQFVAQKPCRKGRAGTNEGSPARWRLVGE